MRILASHPIVPAEAPDPIAVRKNESFGLGERVGVSTYGVIQGVVFFADCKDGYTLRRP